ncbi:hypothetical protein NKW53_05750 [Acetobacter orientalis]|uniref:hypothetical protein n=1 Tax=Acetobacter orientalis TaxID=146474 RepID=UPI00209F62B4|nr:hypothetical protein [Acetobacter orientalis]MCP1215569.1 hypothetical protein [Acetobacter orientalis]MCP1217578.1 hypothetical protein [Acetobacter orientalis]
MARRLMGLALLCLLASCSSVPLRAQHDLIGMPKSDLLACAGVPDRQAVTADGEVLEYRQDQQVQGPFTIKTPINFELDVGGHGTCHMILDMRVGRVAQVHYTGPSATLLGRYAACTPLINACEDQISANAKH